VAPIFLENLWSPSLHLCFIPYTQGYAVTNGAAHTRILEYGHLKDTTYLFAILSNINWHAVIKLIKFADCFKSVEIPTLFMTNKERKRKHRSSTRIVTCAHISYKYFFNGIEYTVINQCNKIHQSV
jgi:hypothetical protein